MKRFILWTVLCVAIAVLAGCITASYNPKTGLISYNRLGDQKVNGFSARIDPNGITTISFESQESTATALSAATTTMADVLKTYMITKPTLP
jgi:hypothetical protein